jgi:hypothetical protein
MPQFVYDYSDDAAAAMTADLARQAKGRDPKAIDAWLAEQLNQYVGPLTVTYQREVIGAALTAKFVSLKEADRADVLAALDAKLVKSAGIADATGEPG